MHELHLMKDLLADLLKLARKNQAKKITRVYLKMGGLTEINEEILKFFFKENSQNTLLEGAQLIIKKSPHRELRLVSFECE